MSFFGYFVSVVVAISCSARLVPPTLESALTLKRVLYMPLNVHSGANLRLWRAQPLKARQLSCNEAGLAFATMHKVAKIRTPYDKGFLIASHQQHASEERRRSPRAGVKCETERAIRKFQV